MEVEMSQFFMLTIITGITRESRAAAVAKIMADKRMWKRPAKVVVGFTTGAPASETDGELYRFVTEEEFARMERRFELAHIDEVDGIRYGYRLADIEAVVAECDAVVVFHQFVEEIDRSVLAPVKSGKRVVTPDNETVTLSRRAFGSLGLRHQPAN
jgi:guanylate kinase